MGHRDKHQMKEVVLSSPEAFTALLDAVRNAQISPYDLVRDRDGHYRWRQISQHIAASHPLTLAAVHNVADVEAVVRQVIEQFAFLVEHRGLWRELWDGGSPRKERSAQLLFFAVAHSYCKANNLDLTPEADTGTGLVDFKVSVGFEARVVVEIKLSTHRNVVGAYSAQLVTYMESEETRSGHYLVIDLGGLGSKESQLRQEREARLSEGRPAPEITVVDGRSQQSASLR